MDAVAFPPPPAPFLDDDFDFGDFTFASAPAPAVPQPPLADPWPAAFDDDWGDFVATPLGSTTDPDASAPPTPPTAASTAWEKPRGPLPLSLFGADDGQEEDEGPAGQPPPTETDTAHQSAPSSSTDGSRPADLKDLIAGLYGSQPQSAASDSETAAQGEAVDGDGFEDDGWEFKAAPVEPVFQDEGGRAHGDGIGKMEDITKPLGTDQEDWLSFTSVDEKMDHVQTKDLIVTLESTGECVKASSYSPPDNAAILNLYKQSQLVDAIHIVQSSSVLFSNNEMFYHRLREESLTVISHHVKDLQEAQKSSTLSGENNKATAVEREIQEIHDKLKDCSLPKDFCTKENPSKDVCITELLNSIKEEHLKDFELEYHLTEKIAQAMEDMNVAVELYKHIVSTLHTLELASKEEQGDYISAWHSILLSCAQELAHGAALWQEFCHSNVCDRVVSEGVYSFIALGEIYRVAQIVYFSLRYFKPWVLSDAGMFSKMLSCLDSCNSAWTSGLEMALKMVVDSNNIEAPIAKALMESIKSINKLEVPNLQKFLPNNETRCRLTLLPNSLFPEMKVTIWNNDHYFVKVANLWANRISSDPPQLSCNPVSSMKNAATLGHSAE